MSLTNEQILFQQQYKYTRSDIWPNKQPILCKNEKCLSYTSRHLDECYFRCNNINCKYKGIIFFMNNHQCENTN